MSDFKEFKLKEIEYDWSIVMKKKEYEFMHGLLSHFNTKLFQLVIQRSYLVRDVKLTL